MKRLMKERMMNKKIKIDLIITRHPGLVKYLVEEGIAGKSVDCATHATPVLVRDKHVVGILPHSLSCLCRTFTEVPLNLPQELRGKELNVDQVREFAGPPVTYEIKRL